MLFVEKKSQNLKIFPLIDGEKQSHLRRILLPVYATTPTFAITLSSSSGDVTCMATIPLDMEVEAYFLAKEDGIVAGIVLAEMIFEQIDPSLKVEWMRKDGDDVHKGLKFGKASGNAHKIVVAEELCSIYAQDDRNGNLYQSFFYIVIAI